MPYAIAFFIAIVMSHIADRTNQHIKIYRKKYRFSNIYIFFGVLVLAGLAGLRDRYIGSDVMSYVYYAFERSKYYSSLIDAIKYGGLEPGYNAVVYLSYKISPDIHLLHFLTSLITLSLFVLFANNFSNKKNMAIMFSIYILMYYNTSLNIVRQFIALSIYLYSSKYLFQGKYVKYLLFSIVAIMFHSSAIITLLILPLYLVLRDTRDSKLKTTGIIGVVLCGLFIAQRLVRFLANAGIVPQQYVSYFSSGGNSSVVMQLIPRIPIILAGILLYKKIDAEDHRGHFIFCLLLIDGIAAVLAPVIGDASRIALYFGMWQCAYIPLVCDAAGKVTKNRKLIVLLAYLYIILYWIYCVPIRNFGHTYPYSSDVIGWLN